ncbi:MAG: hypothetical protein ACYC9O_19975 [Candidatus Latescibacterota bacterium]
MLEVRGISDYERLSFGVGKRRKDEEKDAEFIQLMQTGEVRFQPRVSLEKRGDVEEERFVVSGTDVLMYDGLGKLAPVGALVGRNIDVAI